MKTNSEYANKCEYCGERFVVVSLARCCEMKHEGVEFVRREYKNPISYAKKKPKEDS
jgi:hypothetical protein